MKYRPSKSFVCCVVILCPLLVGSGYFASEISWAAKSKLMISGDRALAAVMRDQPIYAGKWQEVFQHPADWAELGVESLMQWKFNPWEQKPVVPGQHFSEMSASKDPLDRARCQELYRLSAVWFQRVLARHPDMAITRKSVPDARNGYLRWLQFAAQFSPGEMRSEFTPFNPPDDLIEYLKGKGAWNAETARAWLAEQRQLLDEIRSIGLMPDQSDLGVETEGFFSYMHARIAKSSTDALMLEARLAAQDGDLAKSMDAVRAALGLADQYDHIEAPSLRHAGIAGVVRNQTRAFVISQIIPAFSMGEAEIAAWEAALHPTVSPPADFARKLRGDWNLEMRKTILPVLSDVADPQQPPDPEEFINVFTETFRRRIDFFEHLKVGELPTTTFPPSPSAADLSLESRKLNHSLFRGLDGWSFGWEKDQVTSGMTQAAFAIMKGQPIPVDPICGQNYLWDPVTRQLSPPNAERFSGMGIKLITVPKP